MKRVESGQHIARIHQESDSGWRIYVPLLLVLLISLGSYLYIFNFATKSIDQQARIEMKQRVQVALDVEARRLGDLLTEYAYWDEAHQKLIKQLDREWADSNIGAYMADNLSIRLSIAVRGDDTEAVAFLDGEPVGDLLPRLRQAGLDKLMSDIRAEMTRPDPQTAYMNLDGDLLMVSVDHFTPEFEYSPQADGSFLLLARSLSPEYVKAIGELYHIPNLRFTAERQLADEMFQPITDINSVSTQILTWDERSPVSSISVQVALPLTGTFLLMVVIGLWIIHADISRRRAQERILRELATHDPLTGIYNRRQFFQLAQQELGRTNREKGAMSLLILDVDHFKQVNDRYGHLAGDRLLINTAEVLSSGLRDFDIIARYGGEEFVILLPNTQLSQACEIAERLRSEVECSMVVFEGQEIRVTVSIGVTAYRYQEQSRELLARADRALYRAKNDGRNRCCVSQETA